MNMIQFGNMSKRQNTVTLSSMQNVMYQHEIDRNLYPNWVMRNDSSISVFREMQSIACTQPVRGVCGVVSKLEFYLG